MKRTEIVARIAPCFLAILLSACGGKKESPKPPEASAPSAKSAPEPAAGPADAHVEAFRLGFALGPDGQVRDEGSAFGKGDKVFLSFGIRDARPGSSVRVLWLKKPAGTKISEETKALPVDPGRVSFVADAANWATGTYAVEIWVLEPSAEPRRLGAADLTLAATRPK